VKWARYYPALPADGHERKVYTPAPASKQRGKILVECRSRKEDLPPMSRSPVIRAVLAAAALIVFYLLGVAVRQHYGSCVDIRNLSGNTVRQVRVTVEKGGRPTISPILNLVTTSVSTYSQRRNQKLPSELTTAGTSRGTSTCLDLPSLAIAASRWCRFCRRTTRKRMRFTGRCAGKAGWTSCSLRRGLPCSPDLRNR
jgi:hypothetical protein